SGVARAASESERIEVAALLMQRLVTRPWTTELENELLALAETAAPRYATPSSRDAAHARLARFCADQLVKLRKAHELGEVEALEELPRAERRRRELVADSETRRALAQRFAAAADAAGGERAPWL